MYYLKKCAVKWTVLQTCMHAHTHAQTHTSTHNVQLKTGLTFSPGLPDWPDTPMSPGGPCNKNVRRQLTSHSLVSKTSEKLSGQNNTLEVNCNMWTLKLRALIGTVLNTLHTHWAAKPQRNPLNTNYRHSGREVKHRGTLWTQTTGTLEGKWNTEEPSEHKLPALWKGSETHELCSCGLWSELSQARREAGTVRLRSPQESGMMGWQQRLRQLVTGNQAEDTDGTF